ncbi:MAG: C40 family peptidase [Lachnospiraceae bacterium]|nr:C40 family peptidase [Lachnospiraceae bacterium]
MRRLRKALLLILILCLTISTGISATTIDELKKQKKETQKQLDEANEDISELTEVRKGITDEIEQIDDELVEVMTSISILEDEIADIEAQIEVKKAELEEAIRIKEEQYEAMKARIKFMYEKGDATYAQLVFEAKTMGDLVNKAEYIDEMYTYDRQKLAEYIAAMEAVEAAKAALEETQEELETTHYELEQEQDELNTLLAQKKEEAEDYDNQIAKAKQEAAAYKAQIKQQNNQIRKLEEEARKKAEEEKRKAEEAKKKAAEEAVKANSDSSESSSSSSSSTDTATTINNSSGSGTGKDIANYACKFIGNPYVAGGTSLTDGADCSGFTMSVYQAFGYSLPRSSTAQRSAGTGVTYAEAQPGDIICYAGHVAIYIGNGQIVHASTPASGIKIGSATYREILAVRRIV